MNCRHCSASLVHTFLDLGVAPPSNAYLTSATLNAPEHWYPLRVVVCTSCWLVQTEDYSRREELFSGDYAYFSSISPLWLKHSENYVSQMAKRLSLSESSMVIEIASNDGYLLQFVQKLGVPCIGVEPTASTAAAARQKGLTVIEEFFGIATATKMVRDGIQADLIAANNVLAHVPDINDFVSGFAILMKPQGTATFEFPHFLNLVQENQFDTVYHEHFSYLSLTSVSEIFLKNGLTVTDVQELPTHGGSLRVYAQKTKTLQDAPSQAVQRWLDIEEKAGMKSIDFYLEFQKKANSIKDDLLMFLIEAKRRGKKVGAYGAAAKGNTLLNFAGVRPDLLPWVVDKNVAKQGKFLPGSRIPIVPEQEIHEAKPDYVLVLPWNLTSEIVEQLSYIREWGGKFITAVPSLAERNS